VKAVYLIELLVVIVIIAIRGNRYPDVSAPEESLMPTSVTYNAAVTDRLRISTEFIRVLNDLMRYANQSADINISIPRSGAGFVLAFRGSPGNVWHVDEGAGTQSLS
jgi:hypothetical protein